MFVVKSKIKSRTMKLTTEQRSEILSEMASSEAGFNELMRVLLDGFSKQERALFLEEHKGEQSNGFCSRQTLRPANVSMLRACACLQRVDVLRLYLSTMVGLVVK